MLAQPRTYRIPDLAKAESAHTDLGLDRSGAWERLHNPSSESNLEVTAKLDFLKWTLRLSKKNTAYKIEWDWWEKN